MPTVPQGEIVLYQPDETISLEVRVGYNSVWLTQMQMAELFNATKQNVSLHIRNIYEEGELEEESTVKEYLTVRKEDINETTLTLLGKRGTKVKAAIYTRPLSAQQQLDVKRYNQQYSPITVHACQKNHDRFLIIDDVPYLFGASLKDAGKKLFAYIKMQETTAKEILSRIA